MIIMMFDVQFSVLCVISESNYRRRDFDIMWCCDGWCLADLRIELTQFLYGGVGIDRRIKIVTIWLFAIAQRCTRRMNYG